VSLCVPRDERTGQKQLKSHEPHLTLFFSIGTLGTERTGMKNNLTILRLVRFVAWVATTAFTGIIYFLSFLGPALFFNHFRYLSVAALLAIALICYWIAGFVFLTLLIVTRIIFFRNIAPGEISGASKEGQIWTLASILPWLAYTSPFRHSIAGFSWIGPWFFRGMGARMPSSTFIGQDTLIRDPWFLEMGENVSTGSGVMIVGHINQGSKFLLGRITIGNNVLIGIHSIVFPEVRIGNNVVIAAGSVVRRGTVIADGETWGGVPAKLLRPSLESKA